MTACIGAVAYTNHRTPARASVSPYTKVLKKHREAGYWFDTSPRCLATASRAGFVAVKLQQSGCTGQCGERSDEEDEEGCRERERVDREPNGSGSLRPAGLRGRLLEEHAADDAEVVRDREDGVEDKRTDNHIDERGARLGAGQDDPRLAEEAAERRYAHERRHEDPHSESERRAGAEQAVEVLSVLTHEDRKSTRLNSSHANTSYAVFCLKNLKSLTLPYTS